MAFMRRSAEGHIWALDLNAKGETLGPARRVFASTGIDKAARFSNDGSKVAFNSTRSGISATWVCETSGANCFQVSPPEVPALNPEWSPDGKWIAFNTPGEFGWEIDVMRSEGGKPKFLTRGTVEFDGAIVPHWSRDGQSIYFHCGQVQICRVASSGGEAQPVRGLEGEIAVESPDGRWLYFNGGFLDGGPSPLKRIPFSGGPASELVSQVVGRNWVVTPTRLWYVTPSINNSSDIRYFDFASGATRTIFRTEKPVDLGFDVSPDQGRVLFSQAGSKTVGSDIMLVENFR